MTDTSTVQPASPAVEACKRDRLKENLAYMAMGLLALFIFLLFFKGLPDGNAGTVVISVGAALVALTGVVYNFVFGSSQGSQDKNAVIAAQTPPANPSPAQ